MTDAMEAAKVVRNTFFFHLLGLTLLLDVLSDVFMRAIVSSPYEVTANGSIGSSSQQI